MIPLFVGFDERESVAFHVFCHSVLRRASMPVCFCPVTGDPRDGTNAFTYARFLVPYMAGFQGWAIWADGDMLCRADIAELWRLRDAWKDVLVVQHDYRTKHPVKYLGQKNQDYPRKNWSSLMLLNCGAYAWRGITPESIKGMSGAELHRFSFLDDGRVGQLPAEWNWLVGEYPKNAEAKIAHFTIGTPCFPEFAGCDYAAEWHAERDAMMAYEGA